MVSARVALQPAAMPVSVYIWGKNLTNSVVIGPELISTNGDGVVYEAPREYGVGARYEF